MFTHTHSRDSNDILIKSFYIKYCNILNKVIQEAKKHHYNGLIAKYDDKIKIMQKYIHESEIFIFSLRIHIYINFVRNNQELFQRNSSIHNVNTRNRDHLRRPISRLRVFKNVHTVLASESAKFYHQI